MFRLKKLVIEKSFPFMCLNPCYCFDVLWSSKLRMVWIT